MKILLKILNIIFVAVVFFTLAASIGSAVKKEPYLLTVIRSNSMYPVWERGDMILIQNTSDDHLKVGDIAIFKAEEGSLANKGWVAHRIIDGNPTDGFITKGDANPYPDQDGNGSGVIQADWIAGKALTILGKPIVIPLIGYLSLYMEDFRSSPLLLPIIALILGGVIVFEELRGSKKKKRKKNSGFELQLIYVLGGLTMSVLLGSSMLSSSQHLSFTYEVSDNSKGVMTGSEIGILQKGETLERPLAELSNKGAFPLIATITSNDKQITPSVDKMLIKRGDEMNSTFTVNAEEIGKHDSTVHVGLFFPLLPSSVIYFLAEKSYWLALIVVALIPGLPLMFYPIINKRLRRKSIREFHKSIRKFKRFSFI